MRSLRKAFRKLVEKGATNNEELVVGDRHGNFNPVPAKDLLKNLQELTFYNFQSSLQISYQFRVHPLKSGIVLFVSGSDLSKIDACSLRSTFILTVFHLPFVAFLRL